MKSPWLRWLLALFFITAGILHFIFPDQYARTMPSWIPWHDALVSISGLCEIAGGIGVLLARTRCVAGIGLILLSLAVLPANVQMLIDAQHAEKAAWLITLLWLRLPLQALLIIWIWRTTRTTRPTA
ncbi:DoxX family protein [Actimicrobium antarcticum]|uniref:DoxX family protein n=1 Tax=Actimicrobium antarcticum TaxID=1051899 RepID=A0ABP7SSF3_9BURK